MIKCIFHKLNLNVNSFFDLVGFLKGLWELANNTDHICVQEQLEENVFGVVYTLFVIVD